MLPNLARQFRLPADLSPTLRSNIIHYYYDIGWWGLYAGATAAFLTIYATRIGATPAQIGYYSAVPALITLGLSLPFAALVRRMGAHKAAWIGAFLMRLLFLPYALLPFFFSEAQQVHVILVIGIMMAIPNTLVGISFSQLLMQAIPPEWRGMVVSVRNAFFSLITFVVTLISGQILTRFAFPVGYQIVFGIGFVGGVITAYHLYKIRPLVEELPPQLSGTAQPGRFMLFPTRLMPFIGAEGRRYLRVLGLLFLFNITNNMIGPLTPNILVYQLKLSDVWISVGTAISSLIVFFVSLMMGRIVRRMGNRNGTSLGAALVALQVILLALAHDPLQYLCTVVIGGIGSGILMSTQFNYHLDNVPHTDREQWLSWNLLAGNGALLIGSLLGPFLAKFTSVPMALVLFGGMRLVMGLVIWRWG